MLPSFFLHPAIRRSTLSKEVAIRDNIYGLGKCNSSLKRKKILFLLVALRYLDNRLSAIESGEPRKKALSRERALKEPIFYHTLLSRRIP